MYRFCTTFDVTILSQYMSIASQTLTRWGHHIGGECAEGLQWLLRYDQASHILKFKLSKTSVHISGVKWIATTMSIWGSRTHRQDELNTVTLLGY